MEVNNAFQEMTQFYLFTIKTKIMPANGRYLRNNAYICRCSLAEIRFNMLSGAWQRTHDIKSCLLDGSEQATGTIS